MARIRTVVLADCLLAPTELRTWFCGIFALASAMAQLLAEVDSTF
jgi:hypothetical protein